MIAAVFAWFGGSKIPQWVQDLIFVLIAILIVGGIIWYYGHEHYEDGVKQQQTIDNNMRLALVQANDAKTAELQARATAAEKAYDDERNATANFNASNPLEPIRLCGTAAISSGHLSHPGAVVGGSKGTGAAAAGVQQVLEGDSSLRTGDTGRDIGPLLEALAASADSVSASLREFQTR